MSQKEVYIDNCPFCTDGYLRDNGNKLLCTKCNGSGNIELYSPLGVYRHKLDKETSFADLKAIMDYYELGETDFDKDCWYQAWNEWQSKIKQWKENN